MLIQQCEKSRLFTSLLILCYAFLFLAAPHIFFSLLVLPALSIPEQRLSVPKYPHTVSSIKSVTMGTLLASNNRKPGWNIPVSCSIQHNKKSGQRQFQGWSFSSPQCHQVYKLFLCLLSQVGKVLSKSETVFKTSLYHVQVTPQLNHDQKRVPNLLCLPYI